MEEIYIIKLKGLPASSQESLRDNKASFYYRKDLTGEALLGFGLLHTFIGSTLIVLSIINLIRLDISTITVIGSGIWCGAIFAISGLMGMVTAHKRRTDISKSKIQVKIFFTLSIVTFLLTTTYLILILFDLKEKTSNEYISTNIVLSFIFELFTSLLSLFTCMRVIWPGSLAFCAKDWPMHQKLKRKIIVSTQIYTNGVKQNEDVIRNLGPNCVISLSPPQSDAINRNDNHYVMANGCHTVCAFCQQNKDEFHSTPCHQNLRTHCLTAPESDDDNYDSEFDVENFDSMADSEVVCDSTHIEKEPDISLNSEANRNINDCTHESENKYETIDGNQTSDSHLSVSMDDNQSHDRNSSEAVEEVVVEDRGVVVMSQHNRDSAIDSESDDQLPNVCEKSIETISDV